MTPSKTPVWQKEEERMKISLAISAVMFAMSFGLINVVYGADFYGVLRDPNNPGNRPGICSIQFDFVEDKVSVNATANNLKQKRAYSAWVIFNPGTEGSSTAHLDGAIAPKGKSYKFQGDIKLSPGPLFTIQVQVREHPKVKGNTTDLEIIEFVTTPNAGCSETCPTIASCDIFLPII